MEWEGVNIRVNSKVTTPLCLIDIRTKFLLDVYSTWLMCNFICQCSAEQIGIMVWLWTATDSILTHWRDRQESTWNSSSLMVWHLQANGLTSIQEVSTSNMGRIIGYFHIFHDCTVLTTLKVERYLVTGHGCFCFLQYDIFIRDSTAFFGLVVLIVEFLRSQSLRHIALGRTPTDEWSPRRRHLYLTTHNTLISKE